MRLPPPTVVLAGLLAAASCAPLAPPGGRPATVATEPARAAGPAVRPAATLPDLAIRSVLLLLADQRMHEAYTVNEAVKGDAELRRELAVTLGRAGRREGRGMLEGLLIDEAATVRRAAAFALGELEAPESTPALLAAAAGPDRPTAVRAVEALGKIGADLTEVLQALATLEEEERWARLAPHLYRFDDPAVVPLAIRGLEVTGGELRGRVVYALTRDPRESGLPMIRRLIGEADPRHRAWAARALGLIGDGSDLDRLTALVAGAEAGPAIQAMRAGHALVRAGKGAPPGVWRELLLERFDDPRPGVRLTAIEVAGGWLLDEALGERLVRLATVGEGRERELALLALAEGRHPRALDLVATAALAEAPSIRARAAEAAGRLRAPSLLERLSRAAEAPVRAAAYQALLEALEEDAERADEVARRGLADADPSVRGTVFGWLEEHPRIAFEPIARAVLACLDDREIESSLGGIRALAARAVSEPLERGGAIEMLEELAEARDYVVRGAAIDQLAALGRPQPARGTVATGRTTEIYRQILLQTARPRTVEIATEHGALRVRLACPQAPLTCLSFLQLAARGFFDGLTFHRVVPDFVVQGGDPRGDGWGGPGYTLRDEITEIRYRRGVIGMAHAGPHTAGSQFFLTLAPQPHLDGAYTAFGEVVAGEEVLDRIVQGDRILSVVEVSGGDR